MTEDHTQSRAQMQHHHIPFEYDHEHHNYDYIAEMKKVLDPENKMSHMEFMETQRHSGLKQKLIDAAWRKLRIKFDYT